MESININLGNSLRFDDMDSFLNFSNSRLVETLVHFSKEYWQEYYDNYVDKNLNSFDEFIKESTSFSYYPNEHLYYDLLVDEDVKDRLIDIITQVSNITFNIPNAAQLEACGKDIDEIIKPYSAHIERVPKNDEYWIILDFDREQIPIKIYSYNHINIFGLY